MLVRMTRMKRSTVHPHTRGDDALESRHRQFEGGSPPHAWGRSEFHPHRAVTRRFTPTRVGTITESNQTAAIPAVHPHTRGDDAESLASACSRSGSPPHAWGRFFLLGFSVRGPRFTPTRVGTIQTANEAATLSTVHPHTRGDDSISSASCVAMRGSPPHAWGRFHAIHHIASISRFTPTRVGTIRSRAR